MKILSRSEFIKEVYTPMIENKKYEELLVVNEGVLKNLFGNIINLFKKDWGSIKGNKQIIDIYKEKDSKLTGFSTMKLSKKDQCNQIRQKLVDFAEDWLEYTLNKAKDDDSGPKIAKDMKFKDETLKDNLENCKKDIKLL